METVTITCDTCGKEIAEKHIVIGSQEGDNLYFKNSLAHRKNNGLLSLENYSDLHFCSREHFVDYFFRTND